MRYKIYISEVRTWSSEIEAQSREDADEIAENISMELSPTDMTYGDRFVEVEKVPDISQKPIIGI